MRGATSQSRKPVSTKISTPRRSSVTQKLLSDHKAKITAAIQEKKIFRIVSSYDAPKIKSELLKRGFIEQKVIPWHSIYYQMPLQMLVEDAERDEEAEHALNAKLMGHCTPDFMWVTRPQCYDILHGVPALNRILFTGLNFSVKDEICEYIDKINERLGTAARINFPRTFLISPDNAEEITLFRREFKFTIITSTILYLYENKPASKFFCKLNDSVQIEGLDFILRFVENMINVAESIPDKDERYEVIRKIPSERCTFHKIWWRQMMIAHEDVVKFGLRFRADAKMTEDYVKRITRAGEFLTKYFPDRHYEGYHATWMLKPAWSGQGEGIHMSDNRVEIINFLKKANRKYIIQKYIERPLLIWQTKFDLRQYFLISMDRYFFRGWSHPICSVKLASREFTLKHFEESIHVTNTSVQLKYKETTTEALPTHHMWSLAQLEGYLERIGHTNAYNEIIYPEMKRVLKAFTIASYDSIEHRPGRYELLGCDWLITDDLKTFLIEINRAPSLEYYTPVSNKVCGTVLEDLVKVTVDFGRDKNADTGGFEVVHQIKLLERRNTIDDISTQVMGGRMNCGTKIHEKDVSSIPLVQVVA